MTGLLTLVRMGVGFLIAKFVAIYAGPSGLAILSQLQNISVMLGGVLASPVGAGVVRYTAESKTSGMKNAVPYWRSAMRWLLVLSLLFIPPVICFSENLSILLLNNKDLSWLVVLMASLAPLGAIGVLFNSILNGLERYRQYVGLGVLSIVCSALLMIAMLFYMGIKGALIAASLQAALIGSVLILGVLKEPWLKISNIFGQIGTAENSAIGSYILMAIVSAITLPISLMMVRNILVGELGWEQAGIWDAVWRISAAYLGVITAALSVYYLPLLSKAGCLEERRSATNSTVKLILPFIVLMSFTVYLLSDYIILLLFSVEFARGAEIMPIQLFGDVIKILSWLYAYPMLATGAKGWFISTEIFFSALFVFLTLALVPLIGLEGIAWAYVLNYFFYFMVVFINFNRFSR